MSIPFTQLPGFFKQVDNAIHPLVSGVARNVATAIHTAVVMDTPVDTGETRSNWLIGLGSPVVTKIPPHVPYPKRTDPTKKGETANAKATISLGQQFIRRFTTLGRTTPQIWISNNADPIFFLNNGFTISAQTEPFFVERAVLLGTLAGVKLTKLKLVVR